MIITELRGEQRLVMVKDGMDPLSPFPGAMTIDPVMTETAARIRDASDDNGQGDAGGQAAGLNARRGPIVGWVANISDNAFDQRVFQELDAKSAWQNLEDRLRVQVDALGRKHGLLTDQRRKLVIAGRGGIKRFFDRVDEARNRFSLRTVGDVDGAKQLYREFKACSKELDSSFRRGPFGDGSLFAKTLNRIRPAE